MEDKDQRCLLERLEKHLGDDQRCFLCARPLELWGATSEHIIPMWAQRRFDLLDQHLTLLNSTGIAYRNLTVPCCDECNKNRLRPIEDQVLDALSRGPDAVRNLEDRVLFVWLGKILYGLLYKETILLADRADPQAGTIVTPEMLEEFHSYRMLLQQARGVLEMVGDQPASIFVFAAQAPPESKRQWDFCDNVLSGFIAVRMGRVAILANLQDGGAMKSIKPLFEDLFDLPLHPFQFRELCAQFSYLSTLTTRTPKLVTFEGHPHTTIQLPLAGWSLQPYFSDWDQADYAKFLSIYSGFPAEQLFKPPNQTATWLRKQDGRPFFMDYRSSPGLG